MKIKSYASRTLIRAEKTCNLHSGKLEFLTLKWAITEKFRDYHYYDEEFRVFSGNNPFSYVMNTTELHATGMHWIVELADYNFRYKLSYQIISKTSFRKTI